MKNRARIAYLLQEITIVVIGVLIAVSIGNYKERVDNKKYIEKTLLAIEEEIKMSQSAVDTVLNRHLTLLDSLGENIYGNEQALGDLVASLGGVQFPTIKNISLRFFIANKAELVDFTLISQLLEIETFTDVLSDKMKRMADFAYEHINDPGEDVKLSFAYLLADVIDTEESLIEAYSVFIEKHESDLKQAAEQQE